MKRVLLGMSGGVDSSVAAYLLQKEGYEVVGATMALWDFKDEDKDTSIEDAKAVCKRLNIDHYVLDFKDDFKGQVVDNFIDEYFAGKTPNPCVFCNKTIKFGLLFDKAKDLGCDYVATGHYALVEFNETSGKYEIRKASSDSKDQTLTNICHFSLGRFSCIPYLGINTYRSTYFLLSPFDKVYIPCSKACLK